ncbi:hypothetical protein ACFU6K_00125 [Kitasatospora sp. NPDC057512]|uniref:hypothetical protein n=1 Tax=Kitasatospora sp. NPDC057512 TaxID=3346154 RepID=UPI003677B2E8
MRRRPPTLPGLPPHDGLALLGPAPLDGGQAIGRLTSALVNRHPRTRPLFVTQGIDPQAKAACPVAVLADGAVVAPGVLVRDPAQVVAVGLGGAADPCPQVQYGVEAGGIADVGERCWRLAWLRAAGTWRSALITIRRRPAPDAPWIASPAGARTSRPNGSSWTTACS